jgi:transmembrane sensor
MTHQELEKLYARCTSGDCTPEEQKLFEEYRDSFDLSDISWIPVFGDKNAIEEKLKKDLQKRLYKPQISRSKPFYWAAAAFIILLLGGLLYSTKYFTANNNDPHDFANSIKHGSDKAILTLSDGRTIALDDSKKGKVSTQNNVSVDIDKNDRVIYKRNGSNNAHFTERFNVMTTPRGGKYELILSDGTKVWMNAATSIKFPVDFTGNERVVELSGEAYFEVAHNTTKPFKVRSNGQIVQVLGTHFNINAYPDEEAIRTTLLQGSVKVFTNGFSPLSDKKALIIKPNEQAIFKNDQLSSVTVDADEIIAWKNGFILFKNADIKHIMRQIARWYDVDVVYQGQVTEDTYSGEISRNADLAEVFKVLKLSDINLKIDGRKIIVSP